MSNMMQIHRSWSVTRVLLQRTKRTNYCYFHDSAQVMTGNDGEEAGVRSVDVGAANEALSYPGHIRTSLLQKSILAVGSAIMSIANPRRDDMIAVMGEVTGKSALKYMHGKMINDPVGRIILSEKPRINTQTVDIDYLRTLPDNTFGKAYANFLDINRVTPDSRYPVQFVDDVQLLFVMQRYREVHDLFHTLLGMPTNMLGEVVVKWVEGIQLGLPLGILGGLAGPVRLGPKHRQRYLETHLWWAWRVGMNAKFLMNVYYEKHWEKCIHELRAELNIEEPPETPRKMK